MSLIVIVTVLSTVCYLSVADRRNRGSFSSGPQKDVPFTLVWRRPFRKHDGCAIDEAEQHPNILSHAR